MPNTKDTLYREELMDIYKNNKSKGKLTCPTVEVYEKNPMCGDEITLQLEIKDGIVKDAKFDGPACAVSVISSNYLIQNLIGKTLGDAKNMTKDQLLDLIGIPLTTSRVKCATLILEAFNHAIKKYEETKNN
ncbi:MAG: hypothetical protein ACD_22C00088G0002 [uncultured bacterium]|nr:MAG: hypothetical protein ACD_22C00088G0002 [uncultured bacterium]